MWKFRPPSLCGLAVAVAAVLASVETRAAVFTWDADVGTIDAQDGAGVWDNLNSTNWWNASMNTQWDSTTPDSATFGTATGAAGIVTLGSNITVGNLTFNPAASGIYTIAGGGNTLTLSNSAIAGSAGAVISASLAGSTGLTSTNSGTIRLSGANTYSGATSVLIGALQLDSTDALGNSTQISVGDSSGVTGSLHLNVSDATSTTVGAGKTVTIYGSGVNNLGALRGADSGSNTWAGNIMVGSTGSRISGGSGGTLNVSGVISGTGKVLFSVNANATTVLSAVNTYTGDTQLFNGVAGSIATLRIGVDNAISSSSRLTAFSTVSSGMEVLDLNGHALTLRSLDTSARLTPASAANLIVTNNGATASTLTIGGSFGSPGDVFGGSIRDGTSVTSLTKIGSGEQTLVGTNTYTGTTTINDGYLYLGKGNLFPGGRLIGSNGTLASLNIVLNGGVFNVSNHDYDNNNNDRLADAADLTFAGGKFHYSGSELTPTNSSETVHNLNFESGVSRFTVNYSGYNTATFAANALVRAPGAGTAFVNGLNLGSDGTSTSGVGRIVLNTLPMLVGTTAALPSGINSAVQNTEILPFLFGSADPASGGLGNVGPVPNTFLTYGPTTGLRPLNPTDEFTNNAIVAGNNTRLTASTTASASTTINSLIVSGGRLAILETLTNASGAILFEQSGSVVGAAITGGTLDFGSAEAIVTVNSNQSGVIDSKITGSNGLTFYGEGTLGLASQASTYSGSTIIPSGVLLLGVSSVGPAGAVTSGPLGTSTLVLAGGKIRTASNMPVTIGNPVSFQRNSGIGQGGSNLTFSGPVTLVGGNRRWDDITNNSTTTFSGTISDGGLSYGFSVSGNSRVVLSGANTYGGPTLVHGTLIVSGSISGSSVVTVGSGSSALATLGGSGTVGNVVSTGNGNPAASGANIDPGNTADVAGNLKTNEFSLTNGAHLTLQLGGTSAGGENTLGYDRITASGAVTLTDADLTLSLIGPSQFNFGDRLFIIVNDSGSAITGTFATVNNAAFDPSNIVIGGKQFQLVYNANFAGSGSDNVANDVVLVAIPEPSSWMVLIGVAGLIGVSRRRHKFTERLQFRTRPVDPQVAE
jgi:fibronectin-binding autotransporter adhesin